MCIFFFSALCNAEYSLNSGRRTCVPSKDFPHGNPRVEEAQCDEVPESDSSCVPQPSQLTICIEKVEDRPKFDIPPM